MITALTWLSSAESKVADLDSIVEASQTEEQIDMDELQKELVVSLFQLVIYTFPNLVPRVNRPLRETPLSIFDPGIGLVYPQFDWLFKQ